jgi:hypothetical protein
MAHVTAHDTWAVQTLEQPLYHVSVTTVRAAPLLIGGAYLRVADCRISTVSVNLADTELRKGSMVASNGTISRNWGISLLIATFQPLCTTGSHIQGKVTRMLSNYKPFQSSVQSISMGSKRESSKSLLVLVVFPCMLQPALD